jgi:superfamily I DNA/RNA helicase
MPWNDGIDPTTPAFQIAADVGPSIRVLAGPGTGKSFAIKMRVTRLLEEGVAPQSVLAITFTRMSAADLVRDIRSVGVAGAEHVAAKTLHSECFRLLAHNDVIAITGRHPRALAAFEMKPMLEDLRAAAGGRNLKEIRGLVAAYESAWARLQHEAPGFALSGADQVFEDALVAWLIFHRSMLIGELVPFAYRYLRDNPAAPERSRYAHVLVDEYQDLNKAEQEVASQLASAGHLAIVGDDDQSIYTFKNAHRLGIIEFPVSHPGTHNHTMDICQRCPSSVVHLANALISRNPSRPVPRRTLRERAENGAGLVERFNFTHHTREMDYLADRIRQFLNDGIPPGQIIVLCQSRFYIRKLYDILVTLDVPTEFCYQESQLDDVAAAERMALLTLTGNQDDRIGLRYLIGLGSTTWLSRQWTTIRGLCETEGKSPWEILSEMCDNARPASSCTNVTDRFRIFRNQITALAQLRGVDLLAAWLPNRQSYADLHSLANSIVTSQPDINAAELAEAIRETVLEPEVPDNSQHRPTRTGMALTA